MGNDRMGTHARLVAHRRAQHAGARPLWRRVLSLPTFLLLAAVAVGGSGVVWVEADAEAGSNLSRTVQPQLALDAYSPARAVPDRAPEVSRSLARAALNAPSAAELKLQATVERKARERSRALSALAGAAERQAEEIVANRWVMPVSAYVLTSGYGPRWGRLHAGTDFAAPTGTPLVAVARGTVTSAAYDSGYGNKTVITLEDGTEVWYCHQDSIGVSAGQSVEAGDVVGTVGSTGNSTGPHLHLEIHPGGGDAVDPFPYLVGQGLTP